MDRSRVSHRSGRTLPTMKPIQAAQAKDGKLGGHRLQGRLGLPALPREPFPSRLLEDRGHDRVKSPGPNVLRLAIDLWQTF